MVQRESNKMMEMASERGLEKTEKDSIGMVMFDSRIDKKTRTRYFDKETQKFYPRIEAEDHYTLTDGQGRYLHHITKPGKKTLEDIAEEDEEDDGGCEEEDEENNTHPSDASTVYEVVNQQVATVQKLKPAEIVVNLIYDLTVTHLAGDSTNSNTGWKKGVIACLEKKLGRKVNWQICQLHSNELELRHLVEKLDGKTDSKTGWSGPVAKLLAKVKDMRPNYTFKKIEVGPDLIDLPEEVVKDLSTDQHLLYLRCKAARTGHLPRDVALRKSGTIVHSRWVTTAQTFLEMWQSYHSLDGDLLERLETIVTFIVSVYCPMWFNIKVKHSWLDGPRHILTELSLFRLQSPQVQDIVLPTLKRSAWNSHSEAVLQTMLCSDNKEEREHAVTTVLKIRGRNKLGKTKEVVPAEFGSHMSEEIYHLEEGL